MDTVATFVRLTYPIIIGVLLIILAFVLKGGRPLMAPMSVISVYLTGYDIGGWFQHIPRAALRWILCLIALLCFGYPALRDYTFAFPRRFGLSVYFNEGGLRAALSQFPDYYLKNLNIPSDWSVQRLQYLKDMNADLQAINPPFAFAIEQGETFGNGQGSLQIKMVDNEWQEYLIVKASGVLQLETDLPGSAGSKYLRTEYVLSPTGNIPIKASLSNIYWDRGIVSQLEFWQMVRRSPTEQPTHYRTLVALTRVRMLPTVSFGETVYLAPLGRHHVPVAYAVYTPPPD